MYPYAQGRFTLKIVELQAILVLNQSHQSLGILHKKRGNQPWKQRKISSNLKKKHVNDHYSSSQKQPHCYSQDISPLRV